MDKQEIIDVLRDSAALASDGKAQLLLTVEAMQAAASMISESCDTSPYEPLERRRSTVPLKDIPPGHKWKYINACDVFQRLDGNYHVCEALKNRIVSVRYCTGQLIHLPESQRPVILIYEGPERRKVTDGPKVEKAGRGWAVWRQRGGKGYRNEWLANDGKWYHLHNINAAYPNDEATAHAALNRYWQSIGRPGK